MAFVEELKFGAQASEWAGKTASQQRVSERADEEVGERAERAARTSLRGQVAHLEREIATLAAAAYPRIRTVPDETASTPVPRVLGIGELERLRDELVGRLQELRSLTAEQAVEQARRRALLVAMQADPADHRWLRIANAEIGTRGCTVYESQPRLGLIGMLMGWWRVKMSSGCP